jgi:exonuclease III
VRKRKNQ